MDFLCAVSKELANNYAIACRERVWGVIEPYEKLIARANPDDRIFFVVAGMLKGIHRVESPPFRDRTSIWPLHEGASYHGSVYPHRVRIAAACLTSFAMLRDIVDELEFTRNHKKWTGVIQGQNGIFRPLSATDSSQLEAHMRARSVDALLF